MSYVHLPLINNFNKTKVVFFSVKAVRRDDYFYLKEDKHNFNSYGQFGHEAFTSLVGLLSCIFTFYIKGCSWTSQNLQILCIL